jgi:hypothetical protein
MAHVRQILFVLAILAGSLVFVQPQKASALTLAAAQCAVGNPTCAGVIPAVQVSGVGLLGPNRYTVTPFTFAGAFGSVSGTMVAVDINAQFIYLLGFATGTATVASNVDLVISQNYVTAPAAWTFFGLDIGACGGAGGGVSATLAASATGGAIGASTGACPGPFLNTVGPTTFNEGLVTNLTAGLIMSFNGAGVITMPWGDDDPDSAFPNLAITQNETESQFVADLQTDGFAAEVPEPATWAMVLLGVAVTGATLRARRVLACA